MSYSKLGAQAKFYLQKNKILAICEAQFSNCKIEMMIKIAFTIIFLINGCLLQSTGKI